MQNTGSSTLNITVQGANPPTPPIPPKPIVPDLPGLPNTGFFEIAGREVRPTAVLYLTLLVVILTTLIFFLIKRYKNKSEKKGKK